MSDHRTPQNDPFTPGYGVIPRVWAGRDQEFYEFEEIVVSRVRRGIYEPARVVTGDRGVGKTAFLAHLQDSSEQCGDWSVRVDTRRGSSLVEDLAYSVAQMLHANDLAKQLTDTLTGALDRLGGIQVTTSGVRVTTRPQQQSTSNQRGQQLTDLLIEAGQLARRRNVVFAVLVDETQNADRDALGDVCHGLQRAQTTTNVVTGPRGEREHHHLPLVVFLAGLPGLTQAIRGAGATFFERAVPLDFGLLSDADVTAALIAFAANEDVGMDSDALDILVPAISGYPYFLHLIGKQVWVAGTRGAVITAADTKQGLQAAQTDISRFYNERLRGLGEVQYQWLHAAAQVPSEQRTLARIARKLGASSSAQYGWVTDAMIERGLIRHARGRGRVEFTVPGMANYLRDAE